MEKLLRGTALMDPETRKEIARLGGKAVSNDRAHMAEIGRKGGLKVSKSKLHMAEIGRKGGMASGASRKLPDPKTSEEEPQS